MATTNPVYKVMITNGNQGLLAAGNPVGSLADGQLGVFNYETNLSVGTGSDPESFQNIYFALRRGNNYIFSAGQQIQTRNVKNLTIKGTTVGKPRIVEVSGVKVMCEKEYGIKIESRNQAAYYQFGYNGLVKTYVAVADCCEDPCKDCGTGNGAKLMTDLMNSINGDPDKLVTATLFASQTEATVGDPTTDGTAVISVGGTLVEVELLGADSAAQAATKIAAAINAADVKAKASADTDTLTVIDTNTVSGSAASISLVSAGGTGLTLSSITASNPAINDPDTFATTYPGVTPGLRITAQALTDTSSYAGNVEIDYLNSLDNDIIVSGVMGFDCNGKITNVQNPVNDEGLGREILHEEKFALGWGATGPYRQSAVLGGLERGTKDVLYANPTARYNVVSLEYDQFSVGGWLEYLNNLRTLIAVPCNDSTTMAALAAIIDVIFEDKFKPHTTGASLLDCDNDPVNALAAANNGISQLA